jgi:TPR repeat protein
LSADEHVAKAIHLHEHGDLKESTYHLRIAAKQDHPTGMLLYALACRHGWGMRPSPADGVAWLRKAVDSAMLEVADDENPDPNDDRPKADFSEKKAHRAQFALAIYELGQCHLNGWGMDMDKGLALRCFEIAGNWGDTDALTEAGFCYAEGIGCKKDLKKAAKFYRIAEKKGVSMVGNSW